MGNDVDIYFTFKIIASPTTIEEKKGIILILVHVLISMGTNGQQ